MRKQRLILPLLCLTLTLSACGGTSAGTPTDPTPDQEAPVTTPEPTPTPTPEPVSEPAREMDPEDVARLEGTWDCVGVFLDGQLVTFSEMPKLGGLRTANVNAGVTVKYVQPQKPAICADRRLLFYESL